jgi:hypothetical protein
LVRCFEPVPAAKEVMHGNEQVVAAAGRFSIGIATGSLLGVLSKRHVEIGLVPLGILV